MAFAQALTAVIHTLFTYIFQRLHALGPLGNPVLRRISRANRLIQTTMTQLAAGTWKAPRQRAARANKQSAPNAEPKPKRPYIPQTKGWLGTTYGYLIRGYFAQVEHILTRPETQTLLATLPPEALRSLGRHARPLCRLLFIDPPPALRLPPRAPKPGEKKPRKPRPRKLRWRTPYLPPYPTTSSKPITLGRRAPKFFG